MNNNFISTLLLLMVIMVTYSCRNNELLSEYETHNNSNQFQLSAKTIHLDQSRHKALLKVELQKAMTGIQKAQRNISGKTVNCEGGLFIDTHNVTYIENGPNFHTYTFNLHPENAPEDAPIQNLVLAPLTDGTYKEILVSYYLSVQEKQAILNGENVSTKGKSHIVELNGATSNPITSKNQSCSWVEADSFTWCSEGVHHNGEGAGTCNADIKSQLIKVMLLKCESTDDGSGNTGGGGSSGDGSGTEAPGGGTGGGGGMTNPAPTEPCNGNGVATGPQQPNTDMGEGSCSGIPTVPTLPPLDRTTPCDKTKTMLNRPNIQQAISNVKDNARQTLTNPKAGETGFKEKKDGTVVPTDVNSAHLVVFNDVTDGYGGYHNHTATGIHMVSPPDIVDTLLGFAAAQSVNDGVGNAYLGMIAAEPCSSCTDGVKYVHYVIRYAGTAAQLANFVYSPAQMVQFKNDYQTKEGELSEPILNGTTYINSSGKLNEKGLEKLFFDTLTNMGLDNKVILQRIENNGAVYTVTKNSSGAITAAPCP